MKGFQFGGWELVDNMPVAGLPEKVATAWAEVMNICGADYEPVLYVGAQIVNGTNHMILCRQNLVVEGGGSHLVKVVLNCSPSEKWSVLSIETIV